jgi:prophage regulatory protein
LTPSVVSQVVQRFRGPDEASIPGDGFYFPWNDSRAFSNDHEGITMTDSIQKSPATFLRMTQVKARTGLSRSTIYLRIKAGEFPAQVSLGLRAVGWLEIDIERWIATQVERSRTNRGRADGL